MKKDAIKELSSQEIPEKAKDVMDNLFSEAMKTMSMWLRFNYVASITAGESDENINWEKANEILFTNIPEFDFNLVTKVSNKEELLEARSRCIEAPIMNMAFRKGKCKDCGKEFYLTYSEVDYFEQNKLNLPKRCSECRKKRKGTK